MKNSSLLTINVPWGLECGKFSAHAYFQTRNSNLKSVSNKNQLEISRNLIRDNRIEELVRISKNRIFWILISYFLLFLSSLLLSSSSSLFTTTINIYFRVSNGIIVGRSISLSFSRSQINHFLLSLYSCSLLVNSKHGRKNSYFLRPWFKWVKFSHKFVHRVANSFAIAGESQL